MSDFQKAATLDELSDGEVHLVEVADCLVILVRQGDQIHCIDDVCTHDGGTLSDGKLEGCEISCPRHGAKFDVRTGTALTMPATKDTRSHEVKVDDGDIYVRIVES